MKTSQLFENAKDRALAREKEIKTFSTFAESLIRHELPLLLNDSADKTGLAGLDAEIAGLKKWSPNVYALLKKAFK